jgi:hypothetical protein
LLNGLVDLVGIEPTTSSMPCCGSKTKLLTKWHLAVGKTGKTGLVGSICCQNAAKINHRVIGLTVGGSPIEFSLSRASALSTTMLKTSNPSK